MSVTAYIPSFIVTLVILYATWVPSPVGAEVLPAFAGADKLIHMLFGGGLTGALLFDYTRSRPSLRKARPTVIWYVMLAVMAFMAINESVQGMLPIGRPSDYCDLLADWLGVAVAALTAPQAVSLVLKRGQRSR